MGFGNIEGVNKVEAADLPAACYGRMAEMSAGKDTVTGHWEIAGLITRQPMPLYPDGFPRELLGRFESLTGRKTIANVAISGTEVIEQYGDEHVKTGALIVYTSADSVFQIAAHEKIVEPQKLYEYCEIAREMLIEEHAVGRVIARPFIGESGNYRRTSNRRDYSLKPTAKTMLDYLMSAGIDTIGVGKIGDIFAGQGLSRKIKTVSNHDGMAKTIELARSGAEGLIFTNLVDFDMLYGHRNDIDGYAAALSEFDRQLIQLQNSVGDDSLIIITADHGCDPGFSGTDHTREYVPLIIWGRSIKQGINLRTRSTFADIASSVLEYFDVEGDVAGSSFWKEIARY
jgi:phosphopentomutase